MAKESKSRYAILGVLSHRGELSGYDVKQFLLESACYFWAESESQIYPTLKRLTAEGLVTCREDAHGARTRKLYSITDAGIRAIQVWLKDPSIKYQIRDELVLKLFFGCHVEPAVMIEHLQAARARELEFLHLVNNALDNKIDSVLGDRPQYAYVQAVARGGQRCTVATVEWLDETIETLKALEKQN
ncbi:PadR family transcriptional regulator [Piscirickettsia litoralis]|uniref:PadR family transcriptional regulator n=1 Tax=Piscirickettsia litoralis TaxID=1891921 RepID=A0ABX3A5A9_9GAMM|nr:PadR family transcriptional regulator [Piscirickettsia litoralis]